ncbi:hypothetical protein ACFV8Z_18800 [Streptomyces sp. NPDC059837]|uniref:hypothetical protein n=1 Tax=Streptomyces sp. NPDC059837 TaxID=3346968 RepID=UPI0036575A41
MSATSRGTDRNGEADVPRAIRVGLVGPADQLDGLRRWLERCREPIAAKDEKYPHLFPEFPGCDTDRGLHTTLVFSDRNTRAISSRDLRAIETAGQPAALTKAVSIYAEEIRTLADENRVDVLLVARPEQLIDTAGRSARGPKEADELPARDTLDEPPPAQFANFHDLLSPAAAPAPAHPDHPTQHLGRSHPASRGPQSPGRGQPGLEPARRPLLQGRWSPVAPPAQSR